MNVRGIERHASLWDHRAATLSKQLRPMRACACHGRETTLHTPAEEVVVRTHPRSDADDRAQSPAAREAVPRPIRARLFDADGPDRVEAVDPSTLEAPGKRQLLWVDIDRSAIDPFDGVTELLELDADDIERIRADSGRALMTRRNGRLFLTIEELHLTDADDRITRREIDLIATRGVVATIHDGESDAVERFLSGIDGETSIGVLDASDLLSALVDEVIDGYFRVV
jgi:Mg2+ and Co2+ transporter CorA